MKRVTLWSVAIVSLTLVASPGIGAGSHMPGFIVRVERAPDKVTLTCEMGCGWSTVTFGSRDKVMEVNEHGVVADQPAGRPDGTFTLRLERKNGEVVLSCEKGCTWKTPQHDCAGATPCTLKINEYGTTVISRAK